MTKIESLYEFLKAQGAFEVSQKRRPNRKQRRAYEHPTPVTRKIPETMWVGPYWYKEPRLIA